MEPLEKKKWLSILEKWVNTNSHSHHVEGLLSMSLLLEKDFFSLEARFRKKILGNGAPLLIWEKRKSAPLQILFGGHFDTVFPKESPFQRMQKISSKKISGPGVLDMKGGILMILMILEKMELMPWKHHVGWKLILNPDEEIGSIYSKETLFKESKNYDFALWFEPAADMDHLISGRGGSLNIKVTVHGKKAHVGRHFHEGRSAIHGLTKLIHKLDEVKKSDLQINVGKIQGGDGYNIVADHAEAWINVRSFSQKALQSVEATLLKIAKSHNLSIAIDKASFRAARPLTKKSRALFCEYIQCAKQEGIALALKESLGVTDSSSLEPHLPVIDTLGPIGSGLHTEDEFIEAASLFERSHLTYQFIKTKALS